MSGIEETGLAVIDSMAPAVIDSMAPAVIEQAEGQADGTDFGLVDIFEQLVLQSNHAAHEAEAKLQVEEKGNKVADLQGFCAGIRAFKSVAKDAGFNVPPRLFDTANRMTPWVRQIYNGEEFSVDDSDSDTECTLDFDALNVFSAQLDELTRSDEYKQVEESMQGSIKDKKDFLYAEAKTSRDLFWTHGWHRGFTWVQTQIKELHYWKSVKQQQAERKAKEKASMLPFEDDED